MNTPERPKLGKRLNTDTLLRALQPLEGDPHGCTRRYLLVQNVLFKVPVVLLSTSSKHLRILFARYRDDGMTTSSPLRLPTNVSAEGFESYLWALLQQPLPDAHWVPMHRLLDIAELGHKFGCATLKEWGISALTSIAVETPTDLDDVSSSILERLVRIAEATNSTQLSRSVRAKWCSQIHLRQIPAHLALGVADELALSDLQKSAYYILLVEISDPQGGLHQPDDASSLTTSQLTHLWSGYFSLTAHWANHLRLSAPTFTHSPHCTTPIECGIVWRSYWWLAAQKPMFEANGTMVAEADVLRKMKFMELRLSIGGGGLAEKCMARALEALKRKAQEVVDGLLHHFDL